MKSRNHLNPLIAKIFALQPDDRFDPASYPEHAPTRTHHLRDFAPFMRNPVYGLSPRAKKRNAGRRPTPFNVPGVSLMVTPADAAFGMATVDDNDLMIIAISVLTAARNSGEQPGPTITFTPRHMLEAIGRPLGTGRIKDLLGSLQRLHNTHVAYTGPEKRDEHNPLPVFESRLITAFTPAPRDEPNAVGWRKLDAPWSLRVADWLYERIMVDDRLNLKRIEPNMFTLHGNPLERAVARLATVGIRFNPEKEGSALIPVGFVFERTGAKMEWADFEVALRAVTARNRLPDYELDWMEHPERADCIAIQPRSPTTAVVVDEPQPESVPAHPGPSTERREAPVIDCSMPFPMNLNWGSDTGEIPAAELPEEDLLKLLDNPSVGEILLVGPSGADELALGPEKGTPSNSGEVEHLNAIPPDGPGSEARVPECDPPGPTARGDEDLRIEAPNLVLGYARSNRDKMTLNLKKILFGFLSRSAR